MVSFFSWDQYAINSLPAPPAMKRLDDVAVCFPPSGPVCFLFHCDAASSSTCKLTYLLWYDPCPEVAASLLSSEQAFLSVSPTWCLKQGLATLKNVVTPVSLLHPAFRRGSGGNRGQVIEWKEERVD